MMIILAAFLAAAPVQTVDAGGVRVTLEAPVAVERPVRMPVHLKAERLPTKDVVGYAVEGGDTVDVELCDSVQCSIRERTTLVVDGPAVDVEGAIWPGGVHARVRYASEIGETRGDGSSNAHVVASTRPFARSRTVMVGDNPVVGSIVETALLPETLAAHANVLDAFGAIVISSRDPGVVTATFAELLKPYVQAGGVVVTDAALFDKLVPSSAQVNKLEAPPRPFRNSTDSAPTGELTVSDDAAVARVGAGLVVRLSAAIGDYAAAAADAGDDVQLLPNAFGRDRERAQRFSDDGAIAAAIGAAPRLGTWLQRSGNVDDSPAVRVAAVAVGARPNRGIAFGLALFGTLAVLVILVRGRRGRRGRLAAGSGAASVRGTIALCGAAALATTAALWLLGFATTPREERARVVMWTGPDASRETGVDIVRPARTARVSVHGDAPLVGVSFTGARSEPDVDGDATFAGRDASATIPSNTALAGVWIRRAPVTQAVRFDGNGHIKNTLDVPFDVIVFASPSANMQQYAIFNAPAHADVDCAAGVPVNEIDAWHTRNQLEGLDLVEQRAIWEVMNNCRGHMFACGVAVTRKPDGSVFAVEVTQ